MTDLDLNFLHQQVNKALAAAHNGNSQELEGLLSGNVLECLQNDRQGQLVRSAIQNHQTVTFDLAMKMVPPLNPWAARQSLSSAIRHGFLYAATPLLPFVQTDDIFSLIEETVITQQQNFFNIIYSDSFYEEKVLSLFALTQHKHSHNLVGTYTQWKEHWHAQQQNHAIMAQLQTHTTHAKARKI